MPTEELPNLEPTMQELQQMRTQMTPIAYLAGYGNNVNVDGTNTRSLKYGGYFYGGNASAYAYVGVRLGAAITGNSNFKIIGPGTVSTIVASDKVNDTKKIMFAPRST